MKRIRGYGALLVWSALILLSALALAGCQKSTDHTLVLTGSSTVAPLVMELGGRYEAAHPGHRIDVQMGGSSRGVNDARLQLADIGMVSRPLHDDENSDLVAHTIAWDGVTVIVNTANPVAALSNEQIVGIYTGHIRNWKDVGGADAPIAVISKAEGHSTLELFLNFFHLHNDQVKASIIIGDNQQGIKSVAGNRDAIAYVSIGAAEYDARHGTPIRLLPIQGVKALAKHVASGRFPLSRPLNLVTVRAPSREAMAFIDFARSSAADEIVRTHYFVPLSHR